MVYYPLLKICPLFGQYEEGKRFEIRKKHFINENVH
jgi:hypothetical protein